MVGDRIKLMKTIFFLLVVFFSISVFSEENSKETDFSLFLNHIETNGAVYRDCAAISFYLAQNKDLYEVGEVVWHDYQDYYDLVIEIETHKIVEDYFGSSATFANAKRRYERGSEIFLSINFLMKHELNKEEFNKLANIVENQCVPRIIHEYKEVVEKLYRFKHRSIKKLSDLNK